MTSQITPLTSVELVNIDGGIVCAGLCMAGAVAAGFVVGAALTAGALWLMS